MFKKILVASAALSCVAFFATPSFALKGIQALDQCVKTPGCQVDGYKDGAITILGAGGGMIICASLEAECTVHKAARDEPKKRREYQVPQSIVSSGSDTGVPGTGSGGGQTFYQAAPINLGGGGQIQ